MRCRIHSVRGAVVTMLGLAAVLAGCSDGGDWYDKSSSLQSREDEYIRQQTSMGVSKEDAARQFGVEYSIEQTHGREVGTAGTSLEFKK